MTDKQLTLLIQRFMDGTSTVDEETLLARFFSHATEADCPNGISAEDWAAYRDMFAVFARDAAESAPASAAKPVARRGKWRVVMAWVASAAAVALLVVAGIASLPQRGADTQPMSQGNPVEADTPQADSISAEQPQLLGNDSIKRPARKVVRKAHRPYWKPNPPKAYVAKAEEPDCGAGTDSPDAMKLDEAIEQADLVLKVVRANQSAELMQVELQAMDDMMCGEWDDVAQ